MALRLGTLVLRDLATPSIYVCGLKSLAREHNRKAQDQNFSSENFTRVLFTLETFAAKGVHTRFFPELGQEFSYELNTDRV